MKAKYIVGILLVSVLLLSTFVSAGWLNNFFGSVTGNAATTATAPLQKKLVKETVNCVFGSSNAIQSCYSDKGQCKSVKGKDYCSVTISGTAGEKVTWKSSCGGYATTTVDGTNEPITFKCSPETIAVEAVPETTASGGAARCR